ncbi:NDP-hexose 2,3-dehydratase family protein [Streptomyces bacillaris]|uniref:NDP-hexose 2,3-dehydratase family protein n=1 Tax=Streptomyces bacillaris TaxID=68179 RepID=UPI003F4B8E51
MTAPVGTARGGGPLPVPRTDARTAERLALSARTLQGRGLPTEEVADWLAARAAANRFRVDPIPFAALDGWSFAGATGNLVHRSGRFFSVEGVHVTIGDEPLQEWQQPIIVQPEVGILGILAKEFDGVLHFLMQAKMEPGNRNLLQLSPTVQATRSNYTKVHRGAGVKYLGHFLGEGRGRVLADVLQSEHGSWFLRKSNRNMIVETTEDVSAEDDFCWLTLGQIGALLRRDNVVNMDARTVLACAPVGTGGSEALLPDTGLVSWITEERSLHEVRARRIPLETVKEWRRGPDAIEHAEGRYFRVMAVAVQAESREVTRWTQPLLEPVGLGVTAFVTRSFGGVPHVLVHARREGGFLDRVELAPTVQHTPGNYRHLTGADRPPFLDLVADAPPGRVLYEAVHSEEGGRFRHAESRCLFVAADEAEAPAQPPAGYAWVTPGQLNSLVRHGHYVNVQARTLLACLNTAAAALTC